MAALAGAGAARAADVFVSASADGSLRYATQALDTSYTLVHSEAAPAPADGPASNLKSPPRHSSLRPIIERAARRHGVSPSLIEAIVAVESAMNPDAVSARGAQGAMQLMPATAARYGLSDSAALRDPERNVDAGVRHLKELLVQYQGNLVLALAAYNAGAGAVARHHTGIPPYRETMLYVPAVLARAARAP